MDKSKQQIAERLVFDAIEDIEDELELEVKRYPEVHYIYRGFSFESLGLSENYREDIKRLKRKSPVGLHLPSPHIILVNNFEPAFIYEESMHFIHQNQSKIRYSRMREIDMILLGAIGEMIGYFGSKLGDPKQLYPYDEYPDYFYERDKFMQIVKEKRLDGIDLIIHQQGYKLGEKLFNSYLAGIISKRKIREFIKYDFSEKDDVINMFVLLRKDFFKFWKMI